MEVFRSSYESVPEQLISATVQLRMLSGAFTEVFRGSYESVPEQLSSLPEK